MSAQMRGATVLPLSLPPPFSPLFESVVEVPPLYVRPIFKITCIVMLMVTVQEEHVQGFYFSSKPSTRDLCDKFSFIPLSPLTP